MENIKINKKDDLVMKILHYFVTEENYKPIILRGVDNEIWLENLDKPYKLIRLNINYLHNNTQVETDLRKANIIMKKIKKKTFSFKMNLLNILIDTSDYVNEIKEVENISTKLINKINDLKKDKDIETEYPNIKNISSKKSDVEEFMSLTENMNKKNRDDEQRFSKIYNNDKPIVTFSLIIINLIIFLLMYVFGNGSNDSQTLLIFGANSTPYVQAGEVWRLLTSSFLHIGLIHLAFNMYALYILGSEIEKYLGKIKFLVIYLGSAIFGGIFSCLFTNSISAGASGAIFGLFGSLMYFAYHYRSTIGGYIRSNIIPILILNLVLGVMIPGIDMGAHLGGLIGGLALSMALGLEGKTSKMERINGIIITTILLVFICYLLFFVK